MVAATLKGKRWTFLVLNHTQKSQFTFFLGTSNKKSSLVKYYFGLVCKSSCEISGEMMIFDLNDVFRYVWTNLTYLTLILFSKNIVKLYFKSGQVKVVYYSIVTNC